MNIFGLVGCPASRRVALISPPLLCLKVPCTGASWRQSHGPLAECQQPVFSMILDSGTPGWGKDLVLNLGCRGAGGWPWETEIWIFRWQRPKGDGADGGWHHSQLCNCWDVCEPDPWVSPPIAWAFGTLSLTLPLASTLKQLKNPTSTLLPDT